MSFDALRSGLVSITFRKISASQLIEEVVKAGQQGIEWGGDVHVPHGDTRKAEQVARWTRDAGLETAAALLEFVKDDSLEQYHEDARVLKTILREPA
ncbi:MAG: hypothetical protein ACO3N7_00525 [Kiritimatiellia bacterium]